MDAETRMQLFERRRIALPDEFIPLLEPAVRTGVLARSLLKRHFPARSGKGSNRRRRFVELLSTFDVKVWHDDDIPTDQVPTLNAALQTCLEAASSQRTYTGAVDAYFRCLRSLPPHWSHPDQVACAKEMEFWQTMALQAVIILPSFWDRFVGEMKQRFNGQAPQFDLGRDATIAEFWLTPSIRQIWWRIIARYRQMLADYAGDFERSGARYERLPETQSDDRMRLKLRLDLLRHGLGADEAQLRQSVSQFDNAVGQYLDRRNQLAVRNLRLVPGIARRYLGRGLEFCDLIQAGNQGLIKTTERFNWRLGYTFSTYATWWIRQSITREVEDTARTVRVPVHRLQVIHRLARIERRLEFELTRPPLPEEIAEAMHLPVADVRLLIEQAKHVTSLDRPVGEDEDAPLIDFIEDVGATNPAHEAWLELLKHEVGEVIGELSQREARVVRLRFGLTDDGRPRTLEEVGALFNVTRERIRQIEGKALRKLRHPTRRRRLEQFLRDDFTLDPLASYLSG